MGLEFVNKLPSPQEIREQFPLPAGLDRVKEERDAQIRDGYPIHKIPLSEMREGDLLFFPGHVAMYLGGGEYIHSTGRAGDDGVTITSLYADAPNYRADLPGKITAVGSWF